MFFFVRRFDIHKFVYFYKPIILTQEPLKHRKTFKSLIWKFSSLQNFLFEKAILLRSNNSKVQLFELFIIFSPSTRRYTFPQIFSGDCVYYTILFERFIIIESYHVILLCYEIWNVTLSAGVINSSDISMFEEISWPTSCTKKLLQLFSLLNRPLMLIKTELKNRDSNDFTSCSIRVCTLVENWLPFIVWIILRWNADN